MGRSAVAAIEPQRLQTFTEILHEAALRLNRHENLEQLLHDVVDLAQEAVSADSCLVYLYDRHTHDLVLRASSNAHADELGRLHIPVGEGITGWVAQQRRPVAIPRDAANDPRFKLYSSLPEDQYEAFLSVPILNRNVVVGVINLQHRTEHAHDPLEIKTVVALGHILGTALDRATHIDGRDEGERMLRECQSISDLLAGDVVANVPRIAEHLRIAIGASAVYVLLDGHKRDAPSIDAETARAWLAQAETVGAAPREIATHVPNGAGGDSSHTAIFPIRPAGAFAGCIVAIYNSSAELSDSRMRLIGLIARSLASALQIRSLEVRCRDYESALAARKIIERAKGILQREKNISEDEAYRLLQLESRRNRRPMVSVAQALLTSRALSAAPSSVVP
jgi:GAF domain-containing protein